MQNEPIKYTFMIVYQTKLKRASVPVDEEQYISTELSEYCTNRHIYVNGYPFWDLFCYYLLRNFTALLQGKFCSLVPLQPPLIGIDEIC